jgi:hypothetical protein
MLDALEEIKSGALRGGVPDIAWTSEFLQLAAPHKNVYAELGSIFASTVVTFPTVWAHIIGQMLKTVGEDRILFGSEAVYYGSPQWEIEAFWRFQIPEDIRKRWGYPALTDRAKRKILGLNSAKLYGLATGTEDPNENGKDEEKRHRLYKPVPANYESLIPPQLKAILEFQGYKADNFTKMKQRYAELGGERSNVRHGWIRTRV